MGNKEQEQKEQSYVPVGWSFPEDQIILGSALPKGEERDDLMRSLAKIGWGDDRPLPDLTGI